MFGNTLLITMNNKDFKLLFMNNMVYLPICMQNDNLDVNQNDFSKLINNKAIYALAYFDNFHYMSGGASTMQDWIRHSNYSSQKEVEELATVLINAGWSGVPVETAKRCLDALNGIFHEYEKPEPKSDIKIDNNKFERKKSKLKLQYILQNGKNCVSCKHDYDLNYLCLIKKDVNKIGHTLNDVIIICRSCMPAHKKKMKKEIKT